MELNRNLEKKINLFSETLQRADFKIKDIKERKKLIMRQINEAAQTPRMFVFSEIKQFLVDMDSLYVKGYNVDLFIDSLNSEISQFNLELQTQISANIMSRMRLSQKTKITKKKE